MAAGYQLEAVFWMTSLLAQELIYLLRRRQLGIRQVILAPTMHCNVCVLYQKCTTYIHTYQYILPNQLVIFEEISDLSLLGCCSIIACSDGYLSQKNPEFVAPLPIKGLTAWMTKDRTWKNGMGSKHKGERERGGLTSDP